jgi:hypothetical protein
MFGQCILVNFLLVFMLNISNMSTTYFIYPILFDYLISYSQQGQINLTNIEKDCVLIGVIFKIK